MLSGDYEALTVYGEAGSNKRGKMDSFKFLICGAGEAGLHYAEVAEADGRGKIVGLFDPISQQLDKALAQSPDAVASDNY